MDRAGSPARLVVAGLDRGGGMRDRLATRRTPLHRNRGQRGDGEVRRHSLADGGTFTRVDELQRLTYDARSWTEVAEATETIHHTNELTLSDHGETTALTLDIAITEIGSGLKAKLAVVGMKWGYKSQLDALEKHLAG